VAGGYDAVCFFGVPELLSMGGVVHMFNPKILALVMAGGEGKRLYPLTRERSKPAVPFGGRYRIVDFVLSNLVNSEIFSIYLLVQYNSQSLIEHIRRSWGLAPIFPEQFVTVVPPQMREGPGWFQGTADAVFQNLNLIHQLQPDLVAVFGADHVYRMDIRPMVRFHLESDAEVSVAALPVPLNEASAFGVIETTADGRIRAFHEKPEHPPSMPDDDKRAYASMGNYLFRAETLYAALEEANLRGEKEFGADLLPRLCRTQRVYAYNFCADRVPGVRDYEEHGYWRDVGTLDAYYNAHQDLLVPEPRFNLFNPQWRIGSSEYQGPSAKFIHSEIDNSIISSGCLIKGAKVRRSIIRREVLIEEDVELDDCIIMDYSVIRRGARLRRVIVDRYNVIAAGSRIGYDLQRDAERHFVSDSGIVVIPKGAYDGGPGRYL
jgi:glucose-1-phosphate adenylyltransferase